MWLLCWQNRQEVHACALYIIHIYMDVDLDERSWSLGLLQVQCKGKWVHHGENEVLDI
jgi:hypothetical protein